MKSWLENFLAHQPLLSRLVGGIVRPDDIEDIVQETFLHSFAAARKQTIGNPRAFMVTTARNIALNHIARAEYRLAGSLDELLESGRLGEMPSVEHDHQAEEQFRVFCRAVARLPSACRKVFILKKVYGLSQQEIADYLGISSSTVEKHVSKGLIQTADYMERMGHAVRLTSRTPKTTRALAVD